MKRKKIEITVNDADLQTLKNAAKAAKLPLATWAKMVLLQAADPAPIANPDRVQVQSLGGK
jgi:predicted DNA binding CopG/RHH family protein